MRFVAKARFSYKSDWAPCLTHEIVNGGEHFHLITEKKPTLSNSSTLADCSFSLLIHLGKQQMPV